MSRTRQVYDTLCSYLWIGGPLVFLLLVWVKPALPHPASVALTVILAVVLYVICVFIVRNSVREISRLRATSEDRSNTREMIAGLSVTTAGLVVCMILFPIGLLTASRDVTLAVGVVFGVVILALLFHSFFVIRNSQRVIAQAKAQIASRRASVTSDGNN